jgi:hypothetical protein
LCGCLVCEINVKTEACLDQLREDELCKYDGYLCHELPRLVRQKLELRLFELSSSLEEQLRAQIGDIVRDSQAELFECYRKTSSNELKHDPKQLSQYHQTRYLDKEDVLAAYAPIQVLDSRLQAELATALHSDKFIPSFPAIVSDSGYVSNNWPVEPTDSGLDMQNMETVESRLEMDELANNPGTQLSPDKEHNTIIASNLIAPEGGKPMYSGIMQTGLAWNLEFEATDNHLALGDRALFEFCYEDSSRDLSH